jgi:hypothetical protein
MRHLLLYRSVYPINLSTAASMLELFGCEHAAKLRMKVYTFLAALA